MQLPIPSACLTLFSPAVLAIPPAVLCTLLLLCVSPTPPAFAQSFYLQMHIFQQETGSLFLRPMGLHTQGNPDVHTHAETHTCTHVCRDTGLCASNMLTPV